MSLEAKREWRRIAGALHGVGLLTEIDGVALAMLCESLAIYRQAKAALGDEGLVVVSDKGNSYQHPALGIMNSARADALKWAREFGMTPAARSRISLEGGGEQEPSLAEQLFQMVGGQ
jgi:P27 family predicted phage terminase small subunit